MRSSNEVGRRVVALAAAVFSPVLWYYVAGRLFVYPEVSVHSRETVYFSQWAGGAALIAVGARVAGRWRWAIAVPLLLVSAFAGFLLWSLHALSSGESPPGIAWGVVLGTFIIGPAILVVPAAAPRGSGAIAASRRSGWVLSHREALLWAGVVGALAGVFLSLGGPPANKNWRLRRIQGDVVPAARNLVRSDIVTSEPVAWEGCGCAEVPGSWSVAARSGEQSVVAGPKVKVQFLPDLRYARKRGATGEAEGLRADAIRVFVRQPRLLSDEELRNLDVVRPILLSAGINPELVSRLGPDMTASYRGVTYRFVWNIKGPPRYTYARIECSGVRSLAAP